MPPSSTGPPGAADVSVGWRSQTGDAVQPELLSCFNPRVASKDGVLIVNEDRDQKAELVDRQEVEFLQSHGIDLTTTGFEMS